MEPNKLEANFKEQLNSREIKPSEMAWEKLDTILTVAEKPKVNFRWIYIAASILVFFTIGTLLLNENIKEIKTIKSVVIENIRSEGTIKNIQKEVNSYEKVFKQTSKALVETKTKTKTKSEIPKQKVKTDEVFAIVIPKINKIENQTKPIKINEDDLLASVEKELETKANNSVIKINSTVLLNEVDSELELTFREKALKAIAKKYKVTKEAFVNRNNQ